MAKKTDLKEQLKLAEEQRLRALADYQNLEKRVAAKQVQMIKMATSGFILKLIPIIDHLSRAAKHLNNQGLEMILKQLNDLLLDEEVRQIEALGLTFNHETMECVELVEGEKDKVIEVVEIGYQMGDTVLRPAKVKVGNNQI